MEDYMIIWICLISPLMLFSWFYTYKIRERSCETMKFFMFLNNLRHDYVMRNLVYCTFYEEKHPDNWFDTKTPGHYRVLLSNKPFTLEAWFTQEIIDEIYSTYEPPTPEELKAHLEKNGVSCAG